jgi:hypothetical protein
MAMPFLIEFWDEYVVPEDLEETELAEEPDSTDDSDKADDGDIEEGEIS